MKGRITLTANEDVEPRDYSLYEGVIFVDYDIFINTDLTKDFESLTANADALKNSLDISISLSTDPEDIAFYKNCKANALELLKNAEYVAFDFDLNKIAQYVKDNPILKTKKILFTDAFELDLKIVMQIKEAFGNETDNIYFNVVGNTNFISFDEYCATVKAIDLMVQDIQRFGFSPLETIMYAYDLVRNRVYEEVDKGEDKSNSRSLSSVLLGDKIVCVGYSIIFRTLLEKFNIISREVWLYNFDRTSGHVRNEVYIKDDKYGVNGVYYFDPTWDRKKDENDNSYLASYRYFAMTKRTMDSLDADRYVNTLFPYFSPNMVEVFKDFVGKNNFENLPPEMTKSINHMSGFVYGEPLINKAGLLPNAPKVFRPDKDKIANELTRLVKLFDTPLSADILLKVLYTVRKNQYYSNPEKYKMSIMDFLVIILNSGWSFDSDTIDTCLLSELSSKEKVRIKYRQLQQFSEENNLERNIGQVKLTRLLRQDYERKIS